MSIKINVIRKFIINGKEYGSVAEMPENIRVVYEKAKETTLHHETDETGRLGKIVVNGQEYKSVEEIPIDVRQIYQSAMASTKATVTTIGNSTLFPTKTLSADFAGTTRFRIDRGILIFFVSHLLTSIVLVGRYNALPSGVVYFVVPGMIFLRPLMQITALAGIAQSRSMTIASGLMCVLLSSFAWAAIIASILQKMRSKR